MKRFVVEAPEKARIQEVETPRPRRGEALVKVLYVGICGSDVQVYKGTQPFANYPMVPGHEFSGVIVELGADTDTFRVGDVVTGVPYFNCEDCRPCREGRINCCEFNRTMGVAREGALQEFMVLPISRLVSSSGLDPVDLALIEPFSIGAHAVGQLHPEANANWLIIGGGPIGGFSAKSAEAHRPKLLVVSEVEPERVQRINEFGLGIGVRRDECSVATIVEEYTEGQGFDYVVEATGTPNGFVDAIDAAAIGGKISLVGNGTREVTFLQSLLIKKELTVVGSRNSRNLFPQLVEVCLTSGFLPSKLVTQVVNLDDCENIFKFGLGSSDYKVFVEISRQTVE